MSTMQITEELLAAGAERTEVVKTTDGKMFEDDAAALAHQKKLNLKQAMYNFADNHFYTGMNGYDAAEMLVDHLDELADIIAAHKGA
jgi:hypothetical protein